MKTHNNLSQKERSYSAFSTFQEYLNKHKSVYIFVGTTFFTNGIVLDLFINKVSESIFLIAITHFLLIAGEALIVFYLINVILESEAKRKFLHEATDVIRKQESEILNSFSRISDGLMKKVLDFNNQFESASNQMILQTNNLLTALNNDIFKLIIQERTCSEIAHELSQQEFFNNNYLKFDLEILYHFDKMVHDSGNFLLTQDDNFKVKNISKHPANYKMQIQLSPTPQKEYQAVFAGYTKNINEEEYKIITQFDDAVIPNQGESRKVNLKDGIALQSGEIVKCIRKLKTTFKNNDDDLSDYFFTTVYLLPSTIKIVKLENYDFKIFPTFKAELLKGPFDRGDLIIYKLPFLLPGQGFFWSMVKSNKTN